MHVADFKPCTFTRQPSRPQSGQTTLMRQLRQWVRLIHKLGQLGTAEEFLDGCHDRTDIDERLGGHLVLILGSHSFANHTFHTGQADAELVLEQFTDAADTAVAEMINIILASIALDHIQKIVYRRDNIRAVKNPIAVITHSIGADHLDRCSVLFLGHDFHHFHLAEHAALLQDCDGFLVDKGIPLDNDFTGFRIHDRPFRTMALEAVFPGEFLIQLVTSDLRQIITAGIIKEVAEQGRAAFFCRRFAGTELFINSDECFFCILRFILLERLFDMDIIIEKLHDFFIGREPQRTDEVRHGHLAVTVDTDGNNAVGIGFQFDPRAAVRNELGGIDFLPESVHFLFVVYAGRADKLGNNNTFGAIDNKCARVRHNREIAHEKIMLLDFAGFLIDELDFDLQRSGISSISRLAFIDAVLFFLEIVFAEMQRPFMSTILDRRNIRKYIPQPFFTEPFVRFGLQIEQMGHPQNFLRSGVGISFLSTYLDGSEHFAVRHSTPHPFLPYKI